jgi:PAS domain S-box-containing protein
MTKDKKIIDVSLSIWPMKNEAGEIIGASTSAHDITEKKQLEDEILKAKNEWERTFDAVPDMIAIIDKDYRIIRVNRAMADRLGLQPGEVAGHHCYEMVHHQDHPVSLCPHQALLADGQHHVQELHDEILGGDFVVSVSPLKDSSGTVTGSVHLIRDITCSKAAQRQIEDHHNFLERLLETITNPIFYKDKNGVYTGCNSAFEQYLGLKKDQIVGKSVYDIAPADLADIYYAKDKELFDHPGTQTYEAQVKYADGSIHDVIFSKATFTDSEGNIDGLVGIIVDISERKRAEEELRFRNILLATQQEVSIDAILVVGENGEILSYNRRFVDLWQIPPEVIRTKSDELALQSVLDKLSNPREFIDRITYLYEHRHEQSRDEIILNDGRTLDRYSAPMIGSDGHYYGRIWYFRDITERRRAEDSLQQANKKLNMLSSITRHDILNQVMGLRTYLELSKESTTDPQLLDFIRKEDEVAIAIGRQIEFTRSYQDIGMQAPAWQDAGKIIASAAAQLDLKDIALENAVSGTEIFADPLVEKVFYNLMENSLRHGKHVTSVSFSSADNNAGFVITYRDNGVGISADDKQKLFQKGFGSHTGLGLFLSREILSITGISIQENGTPGQGVNFEIIVPKGRYRRISPSPEKI